MSDKARTPDTTPDSRPTKYPQYAVVILNDNDHTFDYVINVLCNIFGYDVQKSVLLSQQIHQQGMSIVWTGPLEVAELKQEQVRQAGPDTAAAIPVTYPLGCKIQELD